MIVVLGMHASGTSLVSKILMAMGVNMGSDFMGPVKGIETWEDVDFVMMNASIIAGANGDWKNVPPDSLIEKSAIKRIDKMKLTVSRKSGLWGFKDPRTALTVKYWHNILPRPVYIIVRRNYDSTAKSLLGRGPSKEDHGFWVSVAEQYNDRIDEFVKLFNPKRIEVRFEKLIHSNTALGELKKIAALVGVAAIPLALREIKFR